ASKVLKLMIAAAPFERRPFGREWQGLVRPPNRHLFCTAHVRLPGENGHGPLHRTIPPITPNRGPTAVSFASVLHKLAQSKHRLLHCTSPLLTLCGRTGRNGCCRTHRHCL